MYHETFNRFYPVTIPAVLTNPVPEHPPRQARIALILGRARALFARQAEQRQNARHRKHLRALSYHILNDIGLERGDVGGGPGPLIKDPTRLRF